MARWGGLVLTVAGGLLAVLGLIALLGADRSAEVVGGAVALVLGLAAGVGGWFLMRAGAQTSPGTWLGDGVRRHLPAILYGSFTALAVVFAVAGVALLSGGADRSAGAVFLAGAVFFVGGIALVAVARRGGGTGAQYTAVGSGIAGAVAIMAVLGVDAADLRRLLQFGIAALAVAVATLVATRAGRERER